MDSVISLPIPDPTAASSITSLKFDKQQNLFVVIDNRILKYNMATKQASQLNIELFEPNGIAFDSEGSLYYSENGPLLVGDAYSYNIPRLRKINAPIKDSYFTPIP